MASIRYFIKSKSSNCSVYVRLTVDSKRRFDRKTSFTTNFDDWSQSKGKTKGKSETQKNLNETLSNLGALIISECNKALGNKLSIDGFWLEGVINKFTGTSHDDSDLLVDWFDKYIKYLPHKKRNGSDKVGVEKSTIKKYENIKEKVVKFQKKEKQIYKVKDVNDDFQVVFLEYLSDNEGLSKNTRGRLLKFLKTVCLYAKRKNVEVNTELDNLVGFREEPIRIILSFEELEKIKQTKFKRDSLDNARDWLIIGCHLGQRVSDLLNLTKENIQTFGEYEIITLIQKKTNKQVAIPLNEEVSTILEKRNGEFPRKISNQNFNLYIKEVAKEAGLVNLIDGAKIDTETKRKVKRKYPKHELITSHICRRSYATNYYNEIPTSLLISVTGHATERQFLEYVGKPPIDQALQLAKLYAKLSYTHKTNSMKVGYKKANMSTA